MKNIILFLYFFFLQNQLVHTCPDHFHQKQKRNSFQRPEQHYWHPVLINRFCRFVTINIFYSFFRTTTKEIMKTFFTFHKKNIFFTFLGFSQISDWLNLEQDMLKKHSVDVGNLDAISLAVDKQKVSKRFYVVLC